MFSSTSAGVDRSQFVFEVWIFVMMISSGTLAAAISTVSNEPLFTTIKADKRSRIQDSPVNAEALLPEGPYDLWKKGETSRRVKDLVGAFALFPHLPKMLRRDEIVRTLAQGPYWLPSFLSRGCLQCFGRLQR